MARVKILCSKFKTVCGTVQFTGPLQVPEKYKMSLLSSASTCIAAATRPFSFVGASCVRRMCYFRSPPPFFARTRPFPFFLAPCSFSLPLCFACPPPRLVQALLSACVLVVDPFPRAPRHSEGSQGLHVVVTPCVRTYIYIYIYLYNFSRLP